MTNHPQPARLVYEPPRYPRPADDSMVKAVLLYGPPNPQDAPAGWLMFDAGASALEWLPTPVPDPDSVPAIVAAAAARALREGAADGLPAAQVWGRLLSTYLGTAPEAVSAAEVRSRIAAAWFRS